MSPAPGRRPPIYLDCHHHSDAPSDWPKHEKTKKHHALRALLEACLCPRERESLYSYMVEFKAPNSVRRASRAFPRRRRESRDAVIATLQQ